MKYVLIADDHVVTRRGLREIVREAIDAAEIYEAADAASVLAQLPAQPWDLVLLDVVMPGGSVFDLLAHIRGVSASLPVLILTATTEIEIVMRTMQAGASGFVHKHRAADDLLEAIKKVSAGGKYLDAETAAAVASALTTRSSPPPHEKLSARELETFRRIALGRSIKEVASDLGVSDKTTATYLARIRDKTGLSSHVEIARYALRHRLVE